MFVWGRMLWLSAGGLFLPSALVLSDSGIRKAGAGSDIAAVCAHVLELDLSFNQLSDWDEVSLHDVTHEPRRVWKPKSSAHTRSYQIFPIIVFGLYFCNSYKNKVSFWGESDDKCSCEEVEIGEIWSFLRTSLFFFCPHFWTFLFSHCPDFHPVMKNETFAFQTMNMNEIMTEKKLKLLILTTDRLKDFKALPTFDIVFTNGYHFKDFMVSFLDQQYVRHL